LPLCFQAHGPQRCGLDKWLIGKDFSGLSTEEGALYYDYYPENFQKQLMNTGTTSAP
jgi:hypothetical protein